MLLDVEILVMELGTGEPVYILCRKLYLTNTYHSLSKNYFFNLGSRFQNGEDPKIWNATDSLEGEVNPTVACDSYGPERLKQSTTHF